MVRYPRGTNPNCTSKAIGIFTALLSLLTMSELEMALAHDDLHGWSAARCSCIGEWMVTACNG